MFWREPKRGIGPASFCLPAERLTARPNRLTGFLHTSSSLSGYSGRLTWVRLQQPQEQRYPLYIHTRCASFALLSNYEHVRTQPQIRRDDRRESRYAHRHRDLLRKPPQFEDLSLPQAQRPKYSCDLHTEGFVAATALWCVGAAAGPRWRDAAVLSPSPSVSPPVSGEYTRVDCCRSPLLNFPHFFLCCGVVVGCFCCCCCVGMLLWKVWTSLMFWCFSLYPRNFPLFLYSGGFTA